MNEIPQTMRALILDGPGEYAVKTVETPRIEDDEVLCKVRAVAICGADPSVLKGAWLTKFRVVPPVIPGHEWSGEVVAVGKNAGTFKVGDRVSGESHKGCGFCRYCKEGRYTLCLNYGKAETGQKQYGFVSDGAYAQYIACHIKALTKMPDNVSYEEASMCDTAGVAYHGIDLIGITPGGVMIVNGCGPIGVMAMKIARARGAAKIIAIDTGTRLETAKKMGADITVDFALQNAADVVARETGAEGADECMECSGAPGVLQVLVPMMRRGGKIVLIGIPKGDDVMESIPFKYVVDNEIVLSGCRSNPNSCANVMAMMSSGILDVKDMVTHTFPLEQFDRALETFVGHKDNALKVVVKPNP